MSILCCSGLDSESRTFQQGQSQPPGFNSRAKSDNLVLRSTLMAQIVVRTEHFLIKTKYTPSLSAWIITSLLPKYQLVAKTAVSYEMLLITYDDKIIHVHDTSTYDSEPHVLTTFMHHSEFS